MSVLKVKKQGVKHRQRKLFSASARSCRHVKPRQKPRPVSRQTRNARASGLHKPEQTATFHLKPPIHSIDKTHTKLPVFKKFRKNVTVKFVHSVCLSESVSAGITTLAGGDNICIDNLS